MARILICEDYPALRDLLLHIVTQMGHEAHAYNPEDAATDSTADLLILEPANPRAREWAHRHRLANPNLPIICVSRRSLRQHAQDLEPMIYLVKPVTIPELQQAITAALGPNFDRAPG